MEGTMEYQQQAQVNDYDMKFVSGDVQGINQIEAVQKIEQQKKEKYENFKTRLEQFSEVSSIEDAKALAQKILPVANETNVFRVGVGKCTIINKEDIFRICLDTADEFISYDFVK